ncbi:hypothetical protein OR626_09125 [Pseudomonas sp. S1Bt30]|uniref:Uncharacterized protein n=1 Tax=Pseudomonas quebecensis TaxID=2995174 RepID=A0ABY6QJB8_9PSED|nr:MULTISPECIES: hypothetical protein [Pseudomonas]MCX4064382.1 hypothetical protein [Pseudomonas quebecensis]UZW19756.1 hypothetical protein OSC50_05260 [Pseudomonas quebecensis]UZW22827.1 hypothetical protein OSC48_20220 [Pseudomonas quebecensis]UZW27889.1 hypothetical protein OSC49_20225 [Pseudomonas quebecensis]CRN00723.1 hypothetical protein [Pseudomonas sp. 34 E 7]
MHPLLEELSSELELLAQEIADQFPSDEPLSTFQSNWSFPGLTGTELMSKAHRLERLITDRGGDFLGSYEEDLASYPKRLQYLRKATVPNMWDNASQAVPAYVLTLEGLEQALEPILLSEHDLSKSIQQSLKKVRAIEARVGDLAERSLDLDQQVARIENANSAAEELPADLQLLKEARQRVDIVVKGADSDKAAIEAAKKRIEELEVTISKAAEDARNVTELCEQAYASATSTGLAAAFTERSRALDFSMWGWVFGLVVALGAGSFFGSIQVERLGRMIGDSSASGFSITVNLVLAVLSVGAPVWFAWLSTKQIGQRFRLSEDYAFKASISRAYEGYRREAAKIDPDLEKQLLKSALSRFDEQPLRLVETDSFGSPWHEFLSSGIIKDAAKSVPGFMQKVTDLAASSLERKGKIEPPKVASNDPSPVEEAKA